MTSAGVVTTLAGLAGSIGSADGTGSTARFYNPAGVTVDSGGNVYVADQNNHTIRKVTSAGVVTTLAGLASRGSADGTGSAGRFANPTGVAVDSGGNVYVADQNNHTIRVGFSGLFEIVSITRVGNDIVLQCLGAPNGVNTVQFSPDLVTQFSTLATRTANAAGAFSFTDVNAVSLTKRFYRLAFP